MIYEAPHRVAETLGGLLEASISPEPSRSTIGDWSPTASDWVAAMESGDGVEHREESGHGQRRTGPGGTEDCAEEQEISGEGGSTRHRRGEEDATAISAAGRRWERRRWSRFSEAGCR